MASAVRPSAASARTWSSAVGSRSGAVAAAAAASAATSCAPRARRASSTSSTSFSRSSSSPTEAISSSGNDRNSTSAGPRHSIKADLRVRGSQPPGGVGVELEGLEPQAVPVRQPLQAIRQRTEVAAEAVDQAVERAGRRAPAGRRATAERPAGPCRPRGHLQGERRQEGASPGAGHGTSWPCTPAPGPEHVHTEGSPCGPPQHCARGAVRRHLARGSAKLSVATEARTVPGRRRRPARPSATPVAAAPPSCGPAASRPAPSTAAVVGAHPRPASSNTPKSSSSSRSTTSSRATACSNRGRVAARVRARSVHLLTVWWSGWPVNPSGPKVITVSGRTSSTTATIRSAASCVSTSAQPPSG